MRSALVCLRVVRHIVRIILLWKYSHASHMSYWWDGICVHFWHMTNPESCGLREFGQASGPQRSVCLLPCGINMCYNGKWFRFSYGFPHPNWTRVTKNTTSPTFTSPEAGWAEPDLNSPVSGPACTSLNDHRSETPPSLSLSLCVLLQAWLLIYVTVNAYLVWIKHGRVWLT